MKKTLRILVAPDKFKGSLTSKEVAEAIDSGIQSAARNVRVVKLPLADGGDGFVEVVTGAFGGIIRKEKNIPDALGRLRVVRYGWVEDSRTAIVEVAGVCGIASLKQGKLNPMKASSYGVGLLIKRLLKRGACKILVGLGGSATNDGGMGFAAGLGYRFKDHHGKILKPCGENLIAIREIKQPPRFNICPICAATDVTYQLLGPEGATYLFGPQKGASRRMLPLLEKGMANLARLAGEKEATIPGTGAAGGLGYGMIVFGKAKLENGFDLMARITKLENEIRRADLVITGEGCLDAQTNGGKVPEGVRRLSIKHRKPVAAFAGIVKDGQGNNYSRVFSLADIASSPRQSIQQASTLLAKQAKLETDSLLELV